MSGDTTFVAGRHWYWIRETRADESLTGMVTITLDGRFEWSFEVPTWRPVNLGAGQDSAYLWTARDLIILPRGNSDEPVAVKVDEDLIFPFRLDDGWVLVCESSVRRLLGQEQTARWELPEVVRHAAWKDGVLSLRDEAGAETMLRASGPDLIPAD